MKNTAPLAFYIAGKHKKKRSIKNNKTEFYSSAVPTYPQQTHVFTTLPQLAQFAPASCNYDPDLNLLQPSGALAEVQLGYRKDFVTDTIFKGNFQHAPLKKIVI